MRSKQVHSTAGIWRALLPVVIAVTVVSLPLDMAAASATSRATSTPSTVSLTSGGYAVKAAGKPWAMSVVAATIGSEALFEASISHATSAGVEIHTWELVLPRGSVTSSGAGKWKIAPLSKATAPLFQISLSFVASSKSALKCTSGSEVRYTGSLKGVLKVATGFAGVGTIGSSSISFAAPNSVVADNGCKQSAPPACDPGVAWVATGSAFVFGASTKAGDFVGLSGIKSLAKPAGAFRFDTVASNEPAATLSGSHLSISTKGGTLLTGHATMVGSGGTHSTTQHCTLGGKSRVETIKSWKLAQFSGSTLTGNTLLTGKVKAPSSAVGTLAEVTL